MGAQGTPGQVLPWPRLYPIAADFSSDLIAGHLPDGTQILVDTHPDYGPATLFCFTAGGEQTELRSLWLPAEYQSRPQDYDGEFAERLKEQLAQTLGFTPGLIRIRELDDTQGGLSIDPAPMWAEEDFGQPDVPAVCPGDDRWALGAADLSSYWLEHGFYVFWCGNDWYVGPDGIVECN